MRLHKSRLVRPVSDGEICHAVLHKSAHSNCTNSFKSFLIGWLGGQCVAISHEHACGQSLTFRVSKFGLSVLCVQIFVNANNLASSVRLLLFCSQSQFPLLWLFPLLLLLLSAILLLLLFLSLISGALFAATPPLKRRTNCLYEVYTVFRLFLHSVCVCCVCIFVVY